MAMRRILLAGLLCAALMQSDVFADETVAPQPAPVLEVPLTAKPSQGPQEGDSAKQSTKSKQEKASADTVSSDEGFTTTISATTDGSATASAPDKAFATKISAPHNGSYQNSIDIREPDFRGVEPNIKLNYDSSQGIANNAAHQNWLGLGWSLQGFSVIERASPGRGTPFNNDTLDTFLVDGLEM